MPPDTFTHLLTQPPAEKREQILLGMDPARVGLLLPEDVLAVVRRGGGDDLCLGGVSRTDHQPPIDPALRLDL